MKGLATLGWGRSRLGDDVSLASSGAGSGVGSGAGSGWGTWGGEWGFRAGNGVLWLLSHRLVLLFTEPLRLVDLCLDGRGSGQALTAPVR
jgi:hypothetical protein